MTDIFAATFFGRKTSFETSGRFEIGDSLHILAEVEDVGCFFDDFRADFDGAKEEV